MFIVLRGFPSEFILPLSLVARTQGFMAHWREAMGKRPSSGASSRINTFTNGPSSGNGADLAP